MQEILSSLKDINFIETLININNEYNELKVKYSNLENENKELVLKLNSCIEDNKNLNKVSYVKSLSTELTQKNMYIQQLETQINKYNTKQDVFDEDKFVEIDNYELLKYKNKYYLKNLDTNDLYSIQNYKPHNIIGKINNKGKINFV